MLCNPFGYESMCLHRVYRTLAERLASVGIATLRFDYHGTGDSSGSDHDEDRLRCWLESVYVAMAELKRRAEVSEISLFGIRWGATLAALAGIDAQRIGGMTSAFGAKSMALWSPYLTGRAFLKEMRMMQTAGAEQAFAAGEDRGVSPSVRSANLEGTPLEKDEEAIGYVLSAQTVEAISMIDLRANKIAPAPRVLLLGRDDLPEDDRFARHIGAAGATVTALRCEGYAAMMQDAYLSAVPTTAFDHVVEFFTSVHRAVREQDDDTSTDRPTLTDFSREGPHLIVDITAQSEAVEAISQRFGFPSAPPPPTGARTDDGRARRVREEVVMFGPTSQLVGVLSEPTDREALKHPNDAVLFLNIGSNHRVGSNRMYVKMARALASRGTTSLRFDIAGIGDSAAIDGKENRLYAKEAVYDVQSAMKEITALRNIHRFYLIGLCSGAYLAFKTAFVDERVAGMILINTQTFQWKEGDTLQVSLRKNYRSTRFYTTEMRNLETWKRVLRGEVNARGIAGTLSQRAFERVIREAEATIARVRHGRLEIDEVAVEMKEILKRGTEALLIFGANDGGLDKMETHLGPDAKKVAKYPNFRLEIVEGSDHTFTPVWSQGWLENLVIATIETWREATERKQGAGSSHSRP